MTMKITFVDFGFFVVAVFVSVDFDFEDDVNFRVIVDLVVVRTVSFSYFICLSCSLFASRSKLKYKQALMKKKSREKKQNCDLTWSDNCR